MTRERISVPSTGLYLAANEKAIHNTRDDVDTRAYLNQSGYGGLTGALLSRTPAGLEHACMCPEGSLADYDGVGMPTLVPNQHSTANKNAPRGGRGAFVRLTFRGDGFVRLLVIVLLFSMRLP